MTGVLAIETATDACSVAVSIQGKTRSRHEVAPRQHNRLLFVQLEQLLCGGNLRDQGIDCIAYGNGPGSFTGLRIAASAVQGLAYSCQLPAIPVSTLAVLAQSALRLGEVEEGDQVLCVLDARINEVYGAVYGYERKRAVLLEGPWACKPAELYLKGSGKLRAVGNGCALAHDFPAPVRARIHSAFPDVLPHAVDMIPLALEKLGRGEIQPPDGVQPVYVRDEIAWKKLAEQGKRS